MTGGEPLLSYKWVLSLAKNAKKLGLAVKLDTNGYFPKQLKKLIGLGLLDYVAMDIKSSKQGYPQAVGRPLDMSKIEESIQTIKDSGLDYEFRSTVVPSLFQEKDIDAIGQLVKGSKRYILQSFSNRNPTIDPKYQHLAPYPDETMRHFKRQLAPYVQNIEWRGD
ncbi:MAG: pyruvate formate lyase activating enzyme [Candidatus Marinamargulisbacteria bacterium]|jgi:pyruvate formate lyase activating enzyme